MPRMVVGRWIVVTVLILGGLQALYLLLRIEPNDLAEALQPAVAWSGLDLPYLATTWKRTVFAIGWVATLSLPILASTRVGNVVHIARDVIDHQYSRRRASMLTQLRKSRDREQWPRRARIQGRFITLLDDIVRRGEFDAIVFVMHSQGSVVAFDFLRDQHIGGQAVGQLRPDLITFGSPLSHLYEHYFVEYANLANDVAALEGIMGRWVNLYRVDDYIGTGVADRPGGPVHNEQLPPGGHTDYWREERLARVLIDLIEHPHATSPYISHNQPSLQPQPSGAIAQMV
ncbi:MAG: hypothetical protein HC869_12815 [Rhodospirillales bacterium]|nr:hypothetical protein [Rhodospirillales bacterium]